MLSSFLAGGNLTAPSMISSFLAGGNLTALVKSKQGCALDIHPMKPSTVYWEVFVCISEG